MHPRHYTPGSSAVLPQLEHELVLQNEVSGQLLLLEEDSQRARSHICITVTAGLDLLEMCALPLLIRIADKHGMAHDQLVVERVSDMQA